jgi:hypothetical protein
MKTLAKKAIRYAETHGFRFERQNSKGLLYYRNDGGVEVCIPPGLAESALRNVCQQVDRACGIGPDLSRKRNAEQIKARRERERELVAQEKRRHAKAMDALAREHAAALLGGRGDELTLQQVKDIERRMEVEAAAHRETVRLMTATPEGGAA